MRGKQLIQFLSAVDALSRPNGVTIRELMEVLGVSRRSVERLLSSLEQMQIPLYSEKPDNEREKRWLLVPSYVKKLPNLTVPNLGLTYAEGICLYLLKRDDPVYKGTMIEKWMDSVFGKLSMLFPDEMRPAMDRIRKLKVTKGIASKSYENHENTLRRIVEAILNQETVSITYDNYSRNRLDRLKVNPLHIFEDSGGIYLIAAKHETGDIRFLAVERVREISLTGCEYDYPENFDPEHFLNKTFGIIDDGKVSVKIRFSAAQARYVSERVWVENQTVEENPDGSVTLSFCTSGRRDLKKWVLSWGKDAVLLEPEDMAGEITRELEKMMAMYKKT